MVNGQHWNNKNSNSRILEICCTIIVMCALLIGYICNLLKINLPLLILFESIELIALFYWIYKNHKKQ
ncbi:unknown [Clostridium sp. CAG:411]|jgi:hypothetical protein|nr:unknown [Clostridium sp. CAG:411]